MIVLTKYKLMLPSRFLFSSSGFKLLLSMKMTLIPFLDKVDKYFDSDFWPKMNHKLD